MILNQLKTAVYAKLTGDATLVALLSTSTAVFDAPAPEGSVPPYVTFQKISGVPSYTFTQQAWNDNLFLIKAVTTGSSKLTGGSIAARVDAVLTDASYTMTGGTVLYARREQDVEYSETDRGVVYHHIGGQYRIWTT